MVKNELITYKVSSYFPPVGLTFDGETIWATQEQIAAAFQTTVQNVSQHILNIYKEGELSQSQTLKKIFKPVDNKQGQQIQHYNLDVVISVGYRINSKRATKFRKWATQVLSERLLDNLKGGMPLTHDEQRVMISDRVAVENNELLDSALNIGVRDGKAFYEAGYQGMYGMRMDAIKQKKGLTNDKLLDRAGIVELAANEFRITQINAILKDYIEEDGNMVGQSVALQTHWKVGQEVREAIGRIGGEMPEDLSVEPDHISEVRKRVLTSKVKPKKIEPTS